MYCLRRSEEMKKILFIVLVIISVIEAKPCMTDIYFGNGVWNDEDAVIKSRDYLKKFMLYKANVRLNPSKNEVDYRFGYVHNPSHGTTNDLIETFWQLKESGQIDYGLFWAKSATLATITGSNGETEIREKINQIVSQYNNDIIPILHAYQGSFNQKHNVLLVAHSQGNLFGNKIYELLSDTQQKKFRMVSVATPASYVKIKGQTSPYVTASLDYVIGAIPNSLPGNVDGRGHTFLGTYLSVKGEGLAIDTGSIRAPRKIALYVKSAYDNLMQTTSCTEYDYIALNILYNSDSIEAKGKISGENATERIISSPIDSFIATYDTTKNAYLCPSGYDIIFFHPDVSLNQDYAVWDISPFVFQDDVLTNEEKKITYQLGNRCYTFVFANTFYETVYNTFN